MAPPPNTCWTHCSDSAVHVTDRGHTDCGWGGHTAWTLTLLSPAGPGPPILKQLLSHVGLCKYTCGPPLGASSVLLESLLDLLHGCLLLLHLTLWKPSQIYHSTAFPRGSLARAKAVTFSLLLVAAPTWEACPGFSAQRPGMQWVFVHLSCNFTILFYGFNSFLMWSLQFLHKESYHLQKGTSILFLSQFGCFLFLSLAWVLWLGVQ